ncbi:SPFH domain / Band 7 family protein [Roseomonas rosea]|uniref:SPFH domain / Band 7 family protein n=1 Tax=Muricoccus roseus TaxID=198092 RepID=A0A1M6M4R7_9PROT|nr:SPFH domain-containing protein [Roseomonas rosea]SHJ78449.1 SPFH domain / Band 7 family protein [Roseomonas rosea]
MPRDDSLPAAGRSKPELTRARAALLGLGGLACLLIASLIYRQVTVQPGTAQRVVISRGGEVVRILGPGQWGIINPWSHSRTVYDMAITAADRSLPDRGMPALSAEGHPLTVFGTAFWHEGEEADLRWRFTHIRAETELMQPLMASAVQAVMGRLRMDEIIRDATAVQAALTEELRRRARDLLRVQVTEFALTRIEPGESYRAVVAEREIGRARADSVAASPAVASNNQNAVDVELIRRWDGRGVIPETMERRDRRPPER